MSLRSLPLAARFPALTSFYSIVYLAAFLPAAVLVYALLPSRLRRYWLLVMSYAFSWLVSGLLTAWLALSTLSIWFFGRVLGRIQTSRDAAVKQLPREERKGARTVWQRKSRAVLAVAIVLHILLLFVLKYSAFFAGTVNAVLRSPVLPIPSFVLPIGISFYTMEALSYLIDVYRGQIAADGNPLRLGLFLAFFPQIVEGPICRYGQTAKQLWDAPPVTFSNLLQGTFRILYGMLKKVVVADRLNMMIDTVYKAPGDFSGGVIAMAAIGYTIQLYMEFSGAMDAVIGSAQIFGIVMPENFQRPFFSRSISEFWKRWHITLGAWFRDYLFYPISMTKAVKSLTLKARKRLGSHYGPVLTGGIALFAVWLCNGLWHGAGWQFVFFGMYHFVLIFLGSLAAPVLGWADEKLHIPTQSPGWRIFQSVRTALLVVIGELFFRAEGLRAGMYMFGRMIGSFSFGLDRQTWEKLHIEPKDFVVVGLILIVVLVVGLLQEKGIHIRKELEHRRALRWAVAYGLLIAIIVFGAYGYGYVPVNPIYANF